MKNYLILSIISFFIHCFDLTGETSIKKVEINPLNRALIYLTDKPDAYVGELSPSKQKITLRLENTLAKTNPNISGSTGIIKNVTITSFKNFSEVLVELSDKRGYTLSYLPYSKSIMLEVFDWNKLSKEEDYYRLGLISYNDGLINEALNYFNKSASKDIPNAYFFLGLIKLSQGHNSEACNFFTLAENYNCNINDNFAGLAEAYRIMEDSKKSKLYMTKFHQKTGISEINNIDVSFGSPVDVTGEDLEPAFLAIIQNPNEANVESDTLASQSIVSADSIKQASKVEIIETPISNSNSNSTSSDILPEWLSNGFIYIAIVLGLFFMLLISLYKKWKQARIIELKKTDNQKFRENLEQARKNAANSKQVANIYQKYDKAPNEEENTQVTKGNLKITNDKPTEAEKVNEIELLAKTIISEKLKSQITEEKNSQDENKPIQNNSQLFKKLNPNLELALHLQNQNISQKQKKLNDIDIEGVALSENLSEYAKKSGIDTGSLKTKKLINELLNNEDAKSSLSKKFLHQPVE